MYQNSESKWLKHWDFILMDAILVEVSLFFAYLLRFGYSMNDFRQYSELGYVVLISNLMIVFFFECYSGILRRGYLLEMKAVLKQCTLTIFLLISFYFITKSSSDISRKVIIYYSILSVLLIYAGHITLKYMLRHAIRQTDDMRNILVIADAEHAPATLEKLNERRYANYHICGLVLTDANPEQPKLQTKVPLIASLEDALDYAKSHVVDEVMLASKIAPAIQEGIAQQFLAMGITVHIRTNYVYQSLPNLSVTNWDNFSFLSSSVKTATTRQMLIKRLIDIASSIVGLLITALCALIFGPIIYAQSPGPIFFSQMRVGKNGRHFRIYKFRSMYMDAEERKKELMQHNEMQGLMFKVKNDPRIIPIGRFLRKSSIDELPQFWNVLKGDMSLVGTRPPTIDEYERYEMKHKVRLSIKPGITGLWQVSGRNKVSDFEEVVSLDRRYIEGWRLSVDVKIIMKTIGVIFNREGAE